MNEDMETVVGEKEVVLESGEVITVQVNKFGLTPDSIHNAKKKELQELLTELKKLEQAQGILRAAAISNQRKLNERDSRIDEDEILPWFKEAALLSYKECEPESNDIKLYYDGEFKGMVEVWTDRTHESRMEAGIAEYILLNHTMYYISDIEVVG